MSDSEEQLSENQQDDAPDWSAPSEMPASEAFSQATRLQQEDLASQFGDQQSQQDPNVLEEEEGSTFREHPQHDAVATEMTPRGHGEEGEETDLATAAESLEGMSNGNEAHQGTYNLVIEMKNDGEEQGKVINVSVENQCRRKPFLGGFRHTISGLEYHHAGAQTEPMKRHDESKKSTKSHRDTQTIKVKARSQQTYREQGTQMAKPGLFIDDRDDKIIILDNMPYFDSEQYEALMLQKTVIVQSYCRGWHARRLARRLRQEKLEQRRREREEARQALEQERAKKQREIEQQIHPRSKADFAQLYNDLETWRLNETNKIHAEELNPDEKQQRFKELLRRETKLLQTIDRLKNTANVENKYARINRELESMAKPKVLVNPNNTITQIETPFTVRARELMDLYQALNTDNLKVDERLDVLLHVKWTVKEFDCVLTRDIVDLIDREADLLNRGRPDKALEGLRKRISSLFLVFIQTPEFNPESINYQQVPLEWSIRPHLEAPKAK